MFLGLLGIVLLGGLLPLLRKVGIVEEGGILGVERRETKVVGELGEGVGVEVVGEFEYVEHNIISMNGGKLKTNFLLLNSNPIAIIA